MLKCLTVNNIESIPEHDFQISMTIFKRRGTFPPAMEFSQRSNSGSIDAQLNCKLTVEHLYTKP